MNVGFIGSGNIARAIALGLGEPAAFADSGSGRAEELARATGGTAGPAATVAQASDLLFLCHKPAQLNDVAAQLAGFAGTIASVLAATPLAALRRAYPSARVVRLMPNTPVELGAGVICVAEESDPDEQLADLLKRLGHVIRLPESQFELATAVGGCAPAFFALFAQQLVDAATQRGMDAATARSIVGGTLNGTGRLLDANDMDTGATIAAVASPGGLTERALHSFDASGLQDAVSRAVATVLGE